MRICNKFDRYWVNLQFQTQPPIWWMTLFLLYKNNYSHAFFQIYYVFAEQELKQGDTIVTNYDTSLVSGMYILNEVCYLIASIASIHFFFGSIIISREHLKRSICQGHCSCFTTFHNISNHLYYNKQSVADSRKFEWYVYLRKDTVATLF